MPIIHSDPSTTRLKAVEAALAHLVRLGRVPHGLEVNSDPIPIAGLHLADIKDKATLLEAAKPVGWRYFAGHSGNVSMVCDMSQGSPSKVLGVIYGEPALAAWQAFQKLPSLEVVQTAHYTPSLLRVPEALTQGFWLKSIVRDVVDQFARCGRCFDDILKKDKPSPVIPIGQLLEVLRSLDIQKYEQSSSKGV